MLPCCCHAVPMLVPCCCHAVAMQLPCRCHAVAMLLTGRCRAVACCHAVPCRCLCMFDVLFTRWASRHQHDGHGGGVRVMVVDVFVCLRSFLMYEALPTPPTLLGLTSSSGSAGRRGTCVPCGALTPPLRTREPGCHGRRRPLRVPQASCWVLPTGCHCPASPVVPWVGPWIWPPRRRRWCWEYWAIPVREDNAPPAPVSVDGEPHTSRMTERVHSNLARGRSNLARGRSNLARRAGRSPWPS